MTDDDTILAELILALDGAPAARMVDVASLVIRRHIPLRGLWLYIADYGDDLLRLVPTDVGPEPTSKELSIRGTVAGRAYMAREAMEAEGDNGVVLWVPVFRRSESVGALGLALEHPDPAAARLGPAIAMVVGAAILAAKRHSDVFELARGAEQLRLAAAMQWDLLPLPTYQDPLVEVAGWVEPAYDIGGDAGIAAGEKYVGAPLPEMNIDVGFASPDSDYGGITYALLETAGPDEQDQLETSARAQRIAELRVARRWSQIEEVAQALMDRGTLDERECREVLEALL